MLFDGNNLVHRAYHAMKARPPMTTRHGEVTTAVRVFASMLLKALEDLRPDYWAIAFDTRVPTFRHEMYEAYKAQRPETPDELVRQMVRVHQLVEAFNMPAYEVDGYEADDVLGTLARQAAGQGVDTVIVTGDADTMQLVGPGVSVLYPSPLGTFSQASFFDAAAVEKKYGVAPQYIPDLKALQGDPSDNIPGVPGIGSKTAASLIRQFGGLEDIYRHIDEVEPPRIRDILRQNEAAARQGKELATIVTAAPVELDLERCRTSRYDRARITELFRELEFNALLARLPEGGDTGAAVEVGTGPPPAGNYHTVATTEALEQLVSRLGGAGAFALDTETTGPSAMKDKLVGLSFSPAPGEAYYVPVGHELLDTVQQLPLAQVLERLRPLLADATVTKVTHNGKFDMIVMAEAGAEVNGVASDTMIAAYLLSERALNLKALAFQRLGIEMTPISELIGSGKKQVSMAQVPIERVAAYACADADMTLRLNEVLLPQLKAEGQWQLYTGVEVPLVPVLVHMERSGIALDRARLQELAALLGEKIARLEREIYESIGYEFNINSPRQLAEVLFEHLKLPGGRRKGGSFSTAAGVLEGLRGTHEVVDFILDYRQLTKLKSTYVDALPEMVNPRTGRLHTSFNQTRTATGRLSSSDPNLQNIPVRGEYAREIRRAFIAPAGSYLFGADYSQIDLRVLAHLSGDERLVAAFRHDEDIHAATAAQLFGVAQDEVTPEMRRLAKTVNFGVIYGMSEYGLEQATELSREEAARFISAYFEKYPGVRAYLERTKQEAREKGFVATILNRRRAIPEITSSNRQVREAAERMAINMPVQGTSADIIKVAMVRLFAEMKKRRLASRMLLQVHDELVFEVPQAELPEIAELVPRVMASALELEVPLKVDSRTGRNWGEMG